jgi:cell division protein FtsB
MFRRLHPSPPDDAPDEAPVEARVALDDDDPIVAPPVGEPGLAALPIAGITRRRAAAVVSGFVAAWIVIVFVRQVGAASAATARADDIAAANGGLHAQVASLERELELIGRQRYIEQQARGYGLGSSREIAFSLAPDAPSLAPDAPGSAAVRVGARAADVSPLERWLTVLFGPSD